MPTIHGQCHCGNLRFCLEWPGDATRIPVRACGCGYCTRHGAAWTSRPDAHLGVTLAHAGDVLEYRFGHRTATFHVCATCGILTFATCTIDDRMLAVINTNTFDDVAPDAIDRGATDFEGESVGSRLARRRRHWMPADVTVAAP